MSTRLPDELVEKILLKVPIKSLLRFLTVSKEWQKLISRLKPLQNSTLFIIYRSSRNNEHVFCHEKDGIFQEYARHEALEEKGNSNFQSCGNGLICFADDDQCVSLWNPWIRRVFDVPKSGVESMKEKRFAFGIVVDHIRNEYKILRTVNSRNHILIEIFRMSTCSWEVVDLEVPFYIMEGNQVDLKGKSYWIAVDFDYDVILVSFGEVFSVVKMNVPALFSTFWIISEKMLFLFEESLVFIHSAHDEADYPGKNLDVKKGQIPLDKENFKPRSMIFVYVDTEMISDEDCVKGKGPLTFSYKVWKMEGNDGESWNLWAHILFDQPVKALGFRENGEFVWAGGWETKKLISINLDDGTYRCLGNCNAIHFHSCQNYVESVALLGATSNDSQPPSL